MPSTNSLQVADDEFGDILSASGTPDISDGLIDAIQTIYSSLPADQVESWDRYLSGEDSDPPPFVRDVFNNFQSRTRNSLIVESSRAQSSMSRSRTALDVIESQLFDLDHLRSLPAGSPELFDYKKAAEKALERDTKAVKDLVQAFPDIQNSAGIVDPNPRVDSVRQKLADMPASLLKELEDFIDSKSVRIVDSTPSGPKELPEPATSADDLLTFPKDDESDVDDEPDDEEDDFPTEDPDDEELDDEELEDNPDEEVLPD